MQSLFLKTRSHGYTAEITWHTMHLSLCTICHCKIHITCSLTIKEYFASSLLTYYDGQNLAALQITQQRSRKCPTINNNILKNRWES